MLVFTRKKNEQVVIDERIVITVVEVSGDRIRLGIEAPKEIAVHRREVYDAIQEESAPGKDAPSQAIAPRSVRIARG